MRIIAGEAGGRRLKSIKGSTVRPTLDRVKEAVFSMLGPFIINSAGLDLFAGFGNLGLEALSRGAVRMTFVEQNYRNINVIRENIDLCGFASRSELRKSDVFTFLRGAAEQYDLIMMDPPYGKGLASKAIELIIEQGLISSQGLIMVEHIVDEQPGDFQGLVIIKNRSYGDTGITIYQTEGGDQDEDQSSLSRQF